jgi:hypothetical protein
MMQNMKNEESGLNRIYGQLAAEKKKAVMALCLLALMGFMWMRALGGKSPKAAEAQQMSRESGREFLEAEKKITFIELPHINGRDVLARDFFAGGNENFGNNKGVDVSSEGKEDGMNQIADSLKLQVIEFGERPKAFINDRLVSVGDKLTVGNSIECEIAGIEKESVIIRCGSAKFTLKMSRANEEKN